MKKISTTNARKQLSNLIDIVRETGEVFAISRHEDIDALLIRFPKNYNKNLSRITNYNAYSPSFDFLADEPDLYSIDDLKKPYV